MPLNAKTVASLAPLPGRKRAAYFDKGPGGVGGLCVRVTAGGHRSYWFRYEIDDTKHWVSIGDVADFSLASAREKAHAFRSQVAKAKRGDSPYPHEDAAALRRATAEAKATAEADAAPVITFETVADAWMESGKVQGPSSVDEPRVHPRHEEALGPGLRHRAAELGPTR